MLKQDLLSEETILYKSGKILFNLSWGVVHLGQENETINVFFQEELKGNNEIRNKKPKEIFYKFVSTKLYTDTANANLWFCTPFHIPKPEASELLICSLSMIILVIYYHGMAKQQLESTNLVSVYPI